MEILNNIIETTLNSFDFTYCIVVNLLTYVIIKLLDEAIKHKLNIWIKRVVLLFVILSTGVVYYQFNEDVKLILNSAILAPVFWSWLMKPICKKFKIDYKNIDYIK